MELTLQKRINQDYITLSTEIAQMVKDKSNPVDLTAKALYNYVDNIAKNNFAIHDKSWLTMIVNWTPPQKQDGSGGANMMEIVKWFDFTKKVGEIDEEQESTIFEITPKEAEMIFEKLRNPNFRILKATTALIYFLHDLEEATNMKINTSSKKEKNGE